MNTFLFLLKSTKHPSLLILLIGLLVIKMKIFQRPAYFSLKMLSCLFFFMNRNETGNFHYSVLNVVELESQIPGTRALMF